VTTVSSGVVDQNDDETERPSSLPVGHHLSSSRTPQSPTRDVTRDGTRDVGRDVGRELTVGGGGRKTVRFADESSPPPPASLDDERAPTGADVGYTIRPHYPTRVALSTFHSSPTTITSEL